jgi:threonine synthase
MKGTKLKCNNCDTKFSKEMLVGARCPNCNSLNVEAVDKLKTSVNYENYDKGSNKLLYVVFSAFFLVLILVAMFNGQYVGHAIIAFVRLLFRAIF